MDADNSSAVLAICSAAVLPAVPARRPSESDARDWPPPDPDPRIGLVRGGQLGLAGRGSLLFRCASDLFRTFLRLLNGVFGFDRCGKRLLASGRELDHVLPQAGQRFDDNASRLGLLDRSFGSRFYSNGCFPNVGLDLFRKSLHVNRALVRHVSQSPHFFGNHSKPASVITSTCGLDCRVEREQVGLIRNPAYRARDFAYILRPAFKFTDDSARGDLPFRISLDRLN